jgi:cytidine deaminase
MSPSIIERAMKKAFDSPCHYKISATGFDKKGQVLGVVFNKPRFSKYKGGLHAEASIIKRYGQNVKTIMICRVNNTGELLPIEPCEACAKLADKLGIRIVSITDII